MQSRGNYLGHDIFWTGSGYIAKGKHDLAATKIGELMEKLEIAHWGRPAGEPRSWKPDEANR